MVAFCVEFSYLKNALREICGHLPVDESTISFGKKALSNRQLKDLKSLPSPEK